MKKKQIIFILLLIIAVIAGSCSRRYYSNHQGKVTKGYNKPPKKWQKPSSRYLKVNKNNKE